MKKLSIIGGAGGIGSTMGFWLGMCNLFEEIALVDIRRELLTSHMMDIEQSIGEFNDTKFSCGSWEALAGSSMVIMAASAPQPKAASRNEFLGINLSVVKGAVEAIKQYCPNAIVVTATVPTEVFNFLFYRELGGNRQKYIAFGRNDSVRLRWACGRVLGVPMRRVGGLVIGEHGETQVPLYSTVTVDGQPAGLSEAQIKEVGSTLANYFKGQMALGAGRSSTWLSPTSISCIIKAICTGEQSGLVPGSAVLDGEYGLSGVSMGVPLLFGPDGWKEIVKLDLTEKEMAALHASANHVKGLMASCGIA